MSTTDICKILRDTKSIAVVGLSRDENKVSRRIAKYLLENGYKVFGVNPNFENNSNFDGIPLHRSLDEIPDKIDLVNVFRNSEDIPELIPDVLKINPNTLWLQSGIRNDEAVKPAVEIGITVIQDLCIFVQHSNCPQN